MLFFRRRNLVWALVGSACVASSGLVASDAYERGGAEGALGSGVEEAVETVDAVEAAGEEAEAAAEEAKETEAATDEAAEAGDVAGLEKAAGETPHIAVSTLCVMEMATGEVRQVKAIPNYPVLNSPEVSPDGKTVAVDGWRNDQRLTDAHVFLIDVESGAVTDVVKGCMPSWSADGRWIALCKYGAERGVYIRSIDGKHEKRIDADGWGIQWAPDGLKAAYSRGGDLVIYDFIGDSKQVIPTGSDPGFQFIYWNCTWSPDSREVCLMGNRGDEIDVAIVDLCGEKPRVRVIADGKPYLPDIAWQPKGNQIALVGKSTPEKPGQIDVLRSDSYGEPTAIKGQPTDAANGGMSWTRDGELMYFLSRK